MSVSLDTSAQGEQLLAASRFLADRTAQRPSLAVILGSGLAGLASGLSGADVIPMTEIPHHPPCTVAGHAGKLHVGRLLGRCVALLEGRLHYYEGYSMWQVTFAVRLLHSLGARVLIVTNAAGGLNPRLVPGDLMLINDHISLPALAGINPLHGSAGMLGPRFVGMAGVYSPDLRRLAVKVAHGLALPIQSGIYAMVGGPSYETPSELRMLRTIGADAVGMSTTPEVVVAAQLGMQVLGISCITNQAIGAEHGARHEELLAVGQAVAPRLGALLHGIIASLPESMA